jgi:uncharacterized protein (DUF924 family)
MINDVLHFWFQEVKPNQWWKKDVAFDNLVRDRFSHLFEQLRNGAHTDWLDSAQGCLARIIALDQFPRNMFREQAQSFSTDHIALDAAKHAITKQFDVDLFAQEKAFLYMPFLHSETLENQAKSIELFTAAGSELAQNLDSALRHKAIIEQFGRFPHRNTILGRKSSQAEIEFLQKPGSRF